MKAAGVSIIICTYNGIQRLSSTFNSILQLHPGINRELVVVDNASTEDISGFCDSYFSKSQSTFDYKLVREEKAGLTHARIAGIRQARYEYLLFCDDDNELFPDYVQLGVRILDQNPSIGVIGGRGIARLNEEFPNWFEKYQHSFAVGPQRSGSGLIEAVPGHVYGAGCFFKRSPMLSILEKGFYPRLSGRSGNSLLSGDDLEWCWLLQLQGYKIFYEEGLQFHHNLSPSRLTQNYYIKLKEGTAAGSALLYAYRTFFGNQNLTELEYFIRYKIEAFKNWLRYLKNSVFKKGDQWEDELAMAILKSRVDSFRSFETESEGLYRDLKRLFFSEK